MLAVQISSPAHACSPPDAWAAEMGRRIPHLSADQAAQAVRSVLEALIENLQEDDILALVAGMNPDMRPGLEGMLSARHPGPLVQQDSLVMAVSARLPRFFPHHACLVTRVVLEIIADCSTQEAVRSIQAAAPPRWRKLWPKSSLCSMVQA
jgi:uncharacterized protein (DUF2267 family)